MAPPCGGKCNPAPPSLQLGCSCLFSQTNFCYRNVTFRQFLNSLKKITSFHPQTSVEQTSTRWIKQMLQAITKTCTRSNCCVFPTKSAANLHEPVVSFGSSGSTTNCFKHWSRSKTIMYVTATNQLSEKVPIFSRRDSVLVNC